MPCGEEGKGYSQDGREDSRNIQISSEEIPVEGIPTEDIPEEEITCIPDHQPGIVNPTESNKQSVEWSKCNCREEKCKKMLRRRDLSETDNSEACKPISDEIEDGGGQPSLKVMRSQLSPPGKVIQNEIRTGENMANLECGD